ncbi:hypothetical protein D3C81_2011880 [compost metagenome]
MGTHMAESLTPTLLLPTLEQIKTFLVCKVVSLFHLLTLATNYTLLMCPMVHTPQDIQKIICILEYLPGLF